MRSTAGVESVCFLHNVHSRFATSDGNMAQRTSTVERSPSASVSSSTRNRGTPISPPEDLHNQTSVQWQTVSETDQLVLLMTALMPGKNTQYKCIS